MKQEPFEKSYVSPFLFDIKRAEIDGPVLQFQSTICEREDIKKLLKTINKACGDEKLSDERLDKAFDVWYPKLEENLDSLRGEEVEESDSAETSPDHSQQMLEEILELTRINQKILRSPDSLLPPDYLKFVLEKDEERDRNEMIAKEQHMVIRDIEHSIYRLREMIEEYRSSEKVVDDELMDWTMRLFEIYRHWEHLERRKSRRRK